MKKKIRERKNKKITREKKRKKGKERRLYFERRGIKKERRLAAGVSAMGKLNTMLKRMN